jgi:hypothetical protein
MRVHMAKEGDVEIWFNDTFPIFLVCQPLWRMVLEQETYMVVLPKGAKIVVEDCVQLTWVDRDKTFKVSASELPPRTVQSNNANAEITHRERNKQIPGQDTFDDCCVQLLERLEEVTLSEGHVLLKY